MDYLVNFALVFSGLIFGYWLWYRDRSNDESLRRQLTKENDDLRLSLKMAHNSHTKLDERFTRQQGQLHVLQQLCDDWASSREQAERDRADLEAIANSNAERLEEVRAELQAEKQRRVALEDQAHTAAQEHLKSVASLESGFNSKIVKLESNEAQQTAKLRTLETDNTRLKKQLGKAESKAAELKADLESQQQLLATATKNQNGLEQEYISLESALESKAQELKQLKTERAEAISNCKVAEGSLATLSQEHESLKQKTESLNEQVAELESFKHQVATLETSLTNSTEQLSLVVAQRDSALDAESASQTVIAGLKKRLDNQEATIHRLRGKYDDALEASRQELDVRAKVETELEGAIAELECLQETLVSESANRSEAIAQLTQQRDQFAEQLAVAETELDEVQTELATLMESHTGTLQQLTGQRDHFADKLKVAEAEMAELVRNHQSKIDELVEEYDELKGQYETANADGENLAKQCDELTALCGDLESKLENEVHTITSLEKSRTELLQKLEERSNRLDRLQDEHQRLEEESHQACQALHDQLLERDQRLAVLEREQEVASQQRIEFHSFQETLSNQTSKLADVENERLELSSRISQLTEQRDALLNELAQTREETVSVNQRYQSANDTIETLNHQVDELEIKCQRIEELEALVKDREIVDKETLEELHQLRQAHSEATTEAESLRLEVERLESQRQEREAETNQGESQIVTLQAKLKASEETIRNLRKERAAVLARLANYRTVAEPDATVISFTEAMAIRAKSETDYDAEYGGPVRTHATRGVVYTEPPKQVDDLKRISGIAEVLEARLNDYGIYTFKQIRDWTPEAIEEFSHLLAFRDRISRDDWVGQADRFYREKQNTPKTYAA